MTKYSWDEDEKADALGAANPLRSGSLSSLTSSLGNPGAAAPAPTTPTPPAAPPASASAAPAAAPTPTKPDSALPGVSGVAGLSGLSGPTAPTPPVAGTDPAPQPQTAGRLVKPTFGGAGALDSLAQQAQSLASITDPQQRAVAQDQVARGVATTLQDAGHTVKWQGDQLMVDGRPYVIGGQPAAAAAAPGVASPTDPAMAQQDLTSGQAPPPNNGAAAAGAQVDPQQAHARVAAAFQQRFNRAITEQEFRALQQAVGFDPNGVVTEDMVAQALDLVGRYSGRIGDPWGDGGGGGGEEEPPVVGTPAWRSQWEGYNPGEVGTEDLDGFDINSLMERLGGPVAANSASTDPATEAMVSSLLANPYTFDQRTVDTMKARSKDELAEMGKMDEAALRNYGFDTGIQDSNWLDSEMNASKRDRDRAIVSGNRDIDIMKAERDMEDRRAAAGLGMEFSDRRFAQALGSAQEQRQAVALASDSSLRASSIRGDRMALREQINAKAAEMGLDADRMQLQYTLGLMDDLTTRYGIDIGRDVDMARLSQQSREFQEDLAFRFEQLREQIALQRELGHLDAGVRLAGYGYSGEDEDFGPSYDPDGDGVPG